MTFPPTIGPPSTLLSPLRVASDGVPASTIAPLLWLLRAGAPWCDLPSVYGNCSSVTNRLTAGAAKASISMFLSASNNLPTGEAISTGNAVHRQPRHPRATEVKRMGYRTATSSAVERQSATVRQLNPHLAQKSLAFAR